jgi:alanine racemase
MFTEDQLRDFGGPFLTYALVDLDAIAHNVRAVLSRTGPGVQTYAVVKANAYGHGAVPVARAALEAGAHRLAVARVDEAVQLRRAGIDAPMLVFTYTLPAEAERVVTGDLAVAIASVEGARALSARAGALGRTATAHVKVDTGMGRYGLLPDEVVPFLEAVSGLPDLRLEGIMTHFAVADEADKTYTREQFARFRAVLDAARAAGHTFALRHCANSAAVIDLPETHLDAVRPGVMLYGLYPSGEVSHDDVALRPAMELHAHIARVKTLPPGSSISYGRTHITDRPTRVVLVPAGYGDGVHRLLSNRGAVLIDGRRAPIIGRVCMDQFMVDATGIDGAARDDPIVLFGQQGDASLPAEEVARWAETINYEVVTAISARVPRVYLRGGRVVEVARLGD